MNDGHLMLSLKNVGFFFALSALVAAIGMAAADRIQNDHLKQVNALTDESIELFRQASEKGSAEALGALQRMAEDNFFGAVIFSARLESKAGNIEKRDQYIRGFVRNGPDLELYLVLQQFDFVFDNAGAAEYVRRAYDVTGRYNADAMRELESTFNLDETKALQACYTRLSTRFKTLKDDQISQLELLISISQQRFGWPRGACSLPTAQVAA